MGGGVDIREFPTPAPCLDPKCISNLLPRSPIWPHPLSQNAGNTRGRGAGVIRECVLRRATGEGKGWNQRSTSHCEKLGSAYRSINVFPHVPPPVYSFRRSPSPSPISHLTHHMHTSHTHPVHPQASNHISQTGYTGSFPYHLILCIPIFGECESGVVGVPEIVVSICPSLLDYSR